MNTQMPARDLPQDKLGSVGQLDDGRYYVTFKRKLQHRIDAVWRAISDPEQLAIWFPQIRLDARLDGRFDIWFDGNCDGPPHVSGTVSRFEPPRVLELGSMRFELEATASGCTLTFTDILHFEGPRSDTEIANAVLGGWHRFLDVLEDALDGTTEVERAEPDYSKIDVPGRP